MTVKYCKCEHTDEAGTMPGEPCPIHPEQRPSKTRLTQDELLDELAALAKHWARNREASHTPVQIRAAMLGVIAEIRPPAEPRDDPNEGPVVNGLVQIADGVLPAFYNRWKCSQCGREPRDVRLNGCGYSQSCGRTAETKEDCRACKGDGVISTGTPGERVACDCPAGEQGEIPSNPFNATLEAIAKARPEDYRRTSGETSNTPVTTWNPDPNGECFHCGLSYLLHIVEDEHGRKDVCMKGYTAQSEPAETKECPYCFGEGAIAMSNGYERRMCTLCNGTGKVPA